MREEKKTKNISVWFLQWYKCQHAVKYEWWFTTQEIYSGFNSFLIRTPAPAFMYTVKKRKKKGQKPRYVCAAEGGKRQISWQIAGVIHSSHVLAFDEWISNTRMNLIQEWQHIRFSFCLACTKPALFPWQPYQWLVWQPLAEQHRPNDKSTMSIPSHFCWDAFQFPLSLFLCMFVCFFFFFFPSLSTKICQLQINLNKKNKIKKKKQHAKWRIVG